MELTSFDSQVGRPPPDDASITSAGRVISTIVSRVRNAMPSFSPSPSTSATAAALLPQRTPPVVVALPPVNVLPAVDPPPAASIVTEADRFGSPKSPRSLLKRRRRQSKRRTTNLKLRSEPISLIVMGFDDEFVHELMGGGGVGFDDDVSSVGASSSSTTQADAHVDVDVDVQDENGRDIDAVSTYTAIDDPIVETGTTAHYNLVSLQAFVRRLRKFGAVASDERDVVRRDFWVRDEISSECYQCKLPFTTFRRRHHCRICGQVFCKRCASTMLPAYILRTTKDIRVCDYCERIVGEYNNAPSVDEYGDTISSTIFPREAISSHGSISSSGGATTTFKARRSFSREHATNNSFEHIRRLFSSGPSIFSGKFWAHTPLPASGLSAVHGADMEQAALPFRKGIADEEVAAAGVEDADDDDKDLVDFFSQAIRADPVSSSPTTADQQSLNNSLTLDAIDDVGSTSRLRRRLTAFSSSKYSANTLRKKLSIATTSEFFSAPNSPKPLQFLDSSVSRTESLTTGIANPQSFEPIAASEKPTYFEVEQGNLEYIQKLLDQMLREHGISHDVWHVVIRLLSGQVCENVVPNVKMGDDMDITRYSKIKKVPGFHSDESQFVRGVVINKNVMHKSMLRTISSPKILLLDFPLEFYRTESQYMSLAPVLSQEKEHLRNLVNRILALNPDIVLVRKSVSRVALDYLVEAKMIVVSNIKQSAMDAISRGTGAEIVASMDKITIRADARLGTCEQFYVKSYYDHTNPSGLRKTLMFFDGCETCKISTVLLRGNDYVHLMKVKRVVKAMIIAFYNLKLESHMKNDMLARHTALLPVYDELDDTSLVLSRFMKPYRDVLLSISPPVSFDPPFLIEAMQHYEVKLRKTMKELSLKTGRSNEERNKLESTEMEIMMIESTVRDFTTHLIQRNLAEFKLSQSLPPTIISGFNFIVANAEYILSPEFHQNLMVLYCNVNTLTSLTCHAPNIHRIDYYKETDMTIGQYLEELCFDSNYLCPSETCQRPMLLHFRSYVHCHARINVLIEEFPCPIKGMESTILTWSLCKVCNSVTTIMPVSDLTWNYSFGKFLEIVFYDRALLPRSDSCTHKLNRDHVRYFGLRNTAVRFEYEEIDLFELFPPPLKMRLNSSALRGMKEKDLDLLRLSITNYYLSVMDRIRAFNIEEIQFTKLNDIQKELTVLGKRVPAEKSAMLQMLQEKFMATDDTDLLALNSVRRVLYDNCCEWDRMFFEIVKKYMLPDKIDRKSALYGGVPMRKLFQDRDLLKNSSDANYELIYGTNRVLDQIAIEMPTLLTSSTGLDEWYRTGQTVQDDPEFPQLGPRLRITGTVLGANSVEIASDAVSALENEIQIAERESLHADSYVEQRVSRFQRDTTSFRLSSTARSSELRSPSRMSTVSSPPTVNMSPREHEHSTSFRSMTLEGSYSNMDDPLSGIGDLFRNSLEVDGRRRASFGADISLAAIMAVPVEELDFEQPVMSPSGDETGFPQLSSDLYPKSPSFEKQLLKSANDASAVASNRGSRAMTERSPKELIPLDIAASQQSVTLPTSERSGLMKTIRDFTRWIQAGQGSSLTQETLMSIVGGEVSLLFEFVGFTPLQYPLTSTDRFINDSDIIIREEEPTSIVAFALNSKHYREEIVKMRKTVESTISMFFGEEPAHVSPEKNNRNSESTINSEIEPEAYTSQEKVYSPGGPQPKAKVEAETAASPNSNLRKSAAIEQTLLKSAGTHIRYEFSAGSTKCSCSVYFAEQFDAIRRFAGCEGGFIQSMSRCMDWKAKGGQSGSSFFKTTDDRFFMKQLSKPEMEAFLRFAPSYFEYISQAFFRELPTVLVKLFGVYRIGYKSSDSGKSRKIDVVVMENLFYGRKPTRIFDLKGSMRNRHVQSTGQQSEVLLDENLLEIIGESPLFIREHSKKMLRASVWNDTLFLSKLNVMDYSMLVGIDDNSKELIIGVVDFIRTFTWDKKLESWVKETGILGGGGREPTIVSPRQYKSRFRESMDRYFLMVPDKYCQSSSNDN